MAYKDPIQRKACDAAWQRAWRLAHPEEVKARNAAHHATHREEDNAHSAAYRAAHPDQVKASTAAWRASHLEQTKARMKAWRAANLEKTKANEAAWRIAHPDVKRATAVAYRKAHPEVHRTANARRKAKQKGLAATLTPAHWQAILTAYRQRCAYCGKKESKKRPLTQDHVIPLAKGGGTTRENIVPACGPCNSKKGTSFAANPVRLVLI